MAQKRFLITNFAYGIGPYLRTTELALALNRAREKARKETFNIIVPWVYGEKQKRIMREDFSAYADSIFLDEKLGSILKTVFYEKETIEEALIRWNQTEEEASRAAHGHLSAPFQVELLNGGEIITIAPRDIVLELARAPRLRYGVAPSYSVSFGLQSEILVEATKESLVKTKKETLLLAAETAQKIEKAQKAHFIAYPATMDYLENRKSVYENEISVPPVTDLPKPYEGTAVTEGLYVTVTGIGGLERLFEDAGKLGLKLYSNNAEVIKGSEKVLPSVLSSGKISLHFARSGWGSAWLSLFTKVPIILPEYDGDDDPEILFNNKAIERLGFGMVYRGESLAEILSRVPAMKTAAQKTKAEIMKKFGTLDGNAYAAKMIAALL
ncbi:MAG: hypothetical protein Q8R17_02590 [bacterium]|nr:hypothetical protein [bacterium]